MRCLTRFKRSTAPSKAWMPNARPQWRCQAPQPRSGAPKAQGLIAALWSQHNPACRRSLQTAAPTQTTFTGAVALMATSAPAVKLHLLDGRDPELPVEIFIDRHLMDISTHRCTVTAIHSQVPLRCHISCEVDAPI